MHKKLLEYHQAKNADRFYPQSTLQDLNIEHVFEKVNHTNTPIGEQFLYCSLSERPKTTNIVVTHEPELANRLNKRFNHLYFEKLNNESIYRLKEGKKSFFHAIDFVSKYNFSEDLKEEIKNEASELFEKHK